MAKPLESVSPAQVFARRIREARERQDWSQAQLAERLGELGLPMDRSTLARLEKGDKAQLTPVDRIFVLAAALGVNPINLLVPLEDDSVIAITPNTKVSASFARAWTRGLVGLPGAGFNFAEMPESEVRSLVRGIVTEGKDKLALMLMDQDKLDAYVRRITAELRGEIPVETEGREEAHVG
jgi:transcriptional regulator with XRE-family HTH domain